MNKLILITGTLLLLQSTSACPDEKNCLSCPVPATGDAICTRCENSFLNPATKSCDTEVKESVSNCKLYVQGVDKALCIACDVGYFLNAAKTACTKCGVEGCAICNDINVCSGCFDKRLLNKTTNTCDAKLKCDQLNCSICLDEKGITDCAFCDNNFALSDLVSKKCLQTTPNCFMVEPRDTSKCSICNYGYYISRDGTCKSSSSSYWWLWLILALVALLVGFLVFTKIQARNRDMYAAV